MAQRPVPRDATGKLLPDVTELLNLEHDCPRCEGVGIIQDPRHAAAWWQRYKAARDAYETANPGHSWYGTPEEQRLETDMPDGTNEEIDCPECHGCGTVPTEAGLVLLVFLRNHWRS